MHLQHIALLLLIGGAYTESQRGHLQAYSEKTRAKIHRSLWNRANNSPAISADGSCGVGTFGAYTCRGSAYGSCCGGNGACGNDAASCDVTMGCNSDYGVCDEPNASSSTAEDGAPATLAATTSAARIGAPFPLTNTSSITSVTSTSSNNDVITAPGVQVNSSSTTINPTFGSGGRNGTALSSPFPGRTSSSSNSLGGGGLGFGNRNGTQTAPTPTNGGAGAAGNRTGNQSSPTLGSNASKPTSSTPVSGIAGGGGANTSEAGSAALGQRIGSATPVSTIATPPAGQVCVVYASITTLS